MKPVGPGFGDIVHLRSAITALVNRVRNRIDRHFGDGVQAQNEVGGKAAVQIGQRIVSLQSIDNVAVGKRGQAIELHIAVAVGAADEVVTAAGGVDEGAGGELQRISHVAAGIRKVFESRGGESGGGVGIFGIELRRLLVHHDALARGCNVELQIDRLGQPETCRYRSILTCFKAVCLRSDGIDSRLQLGKAIAPCVVRFDGAFHAIVAAGNGHGGRGDRGAGGVGDRAGDGAGGLALRHGAKAEEQHGQNSIPDFRHA